jgi:hypothetical protein
MIKMDPALSRRQAGRQPALIGTGPGTKINDLQVRFAIAGVGQIVDQFREQRTYCCGASGGVGCDSGGEPVRVDGGLCGRSR